MVIYNIWNYIINTAQNQIKKQNKENKKHPPKK